MRPRTRRGKTWNSGRELGERYTSFAYANNIRLMLRKVVNTSASEEVQFYVDRFLILVVRLVKGYVNLSRIIARTYMNSDLRAYVFYMIIFFIVVVLVVVI